MSSVPPRTQSLDDVEQGKATSLSEKPGVTSRPSRSRSVRSTRSETQVSGSSTSGEAEVGPRQQPTRLRSAIGGTLRRNPSPAKRWWARVRGKDRKKIGWMASLKAIVLSSCTSISYSPYSILSSWADGEGLLVEVYFEGTKVSFSILETGFRSDLANEERVRRLGVSASELPPSYRSGGTGACLHPFKAVASCGPSLTLLL